MPDSSRGVSPALFRQVELAKQEWERIMDCVADVVLFVDPAERIKRCNKSLAQLTGKEFRDLLGSDWRVVFAEVGLEEREGVAEGREFFHPATSRTFLSFVYPLYLQNGALCGSVITLCDVSQRKGLIEQLEQKNREIASQHRALQQALDQLSSAICQVVAQGGFDVYLKLPSNLGGCWQVMECGQEECPCYGKNEGHCWQVAGTHCGKRLYGYFAKKFGACEQCTYYQRSAHELIVQRIGEEFNQMVFILGEKNKELAEAYEGLKSSHAKLLQQEKMASIGQLAAGVAHEINNPMGFITSNLGSLEKYLKRLADFEAKQAEVVRQCATQEQATELEQLRKELKVDFILGDSAALIQESLDGAGRVRTIVQNLKSFSRVDQAQESEADINQCLDDTINIVWNELKYKCEIRKEYGDIPRTRCFPQQLNQVFMNLLVNASHAIAERGTITIQSRQAGDEIIVAISDTGCGIAPEHMDRLFEPFFTTKEVGKGTGLGLSIAYDIVKNHEGRVEVASEPGKGTTFTVFLPIRGAAHE